MRNRSIQIFALSLTLTALTGCDVINQILEGNVTFQFGNVVLAGPGARKVRDDRPGAVLGTMAQAIPSGTQQKAKSSWGTCDPTAADVVTGAFRKAEAEISELQITSVSHARQALTLKFAKRTVNLLRLASEISGILTSATIPAGEYREVVVKLENATLTSHSGQVLPLELSEGGQSAIRIVLERTIVIEQPSDAEKISLSFCTEGNFLMGDKSGTNAKAAFHPIIDQVANLSI